MTSLFKFVQDDQELYNLLDDETDIPADQLYAMLEASEEAINEKAARVVAYIKTLEADADALANIAKGYRARSDVLGRKADSLRDYLRMCLERSGGDNIGTLEHSAKLIKARASVVIDDIERLPDHVKKTVVTISADKNAIKSEIESGAEISGAHLEYKAGLKIV